MKLKLVAFAAAVVLSWPLLQDRGPLAQGKADTHSHAQHSSAERWSATTGFQRSLYDATMRMHEDMLRSAPSGNPDVDFLSQMIPHHEGAVEMARLYLAVGNDPLVRRLAEEIIAGQQAEIAAMKARLGILRKGADPNPGGFPSLGGSRGQ